MKRATTRRLVAVVLTLTMAGCQPSTPASAIESVLNQCARISDSVNKSNMNAAQAAEYFAEQGQAIDTRDCPPDFRAAFQEHINAWRDATPYLVNNTPLNAFLEGFIGGYTGDYNQVGESQREANIAVQRINDTYNTLVTIAAADGARVPRSVIEK